jgi:PAS domain S-box-containing protein
VAIDAKFSRRLATASCNWDSTVLENLPVAVVACGADGRVVQYNRKAAELFGMELESGERFDQAVRLLRPDGGPIGEVGGLMAELLRAGRSQRDVELFLDRPAGRRVHLLANVDPITGGNGAIGCFTDITGCAKSNRLGQPEPCEQRYRELLELLPSAVYTTDAEGRITFYNKAAVDLSGRTPELGTDRWCVTWRLYHPDGAPMPHDQCPMAVALRERRPVRGAEAIAERPDGTRVPFVPYPTPLFDEDGELVGAINMLVDVSDRKLAGEYANRLASIVESSDDAIVSKDLNGVINSWNAGARRLFGYTAEEVIGEPIYMLIPPERRDEEPGILERIRRGERIDHYETIRRRKDGSLVDISLTVSPLKNDDGRIIGASKIARDISDRKREEERRKLLINELNHRVKNTLASVQSIAAQTFRGKSGYPSKEFEERLVALARAHDILTRESWDGADLRDLATGVIAPLCVDHANRVGILGPRLRLRPKVALSLSIAFHELCTNAVKYGALGEEGGRVDLGWSVQSPRGENWLRIRWEETGGPTVRPTSCRGFGIKLLERGVARELGAQVQLRFLPSGVVCEIEAPLA